MFLTYKPSSDSYFALSVKPELSLKPEIFQFVGVCRMCMGYIIQYWISLIKYCFNVIVPIKFKFKPPCLGEPYRKCCSWSSDDNTSSKSDVEENAEDSPVRKRRRPLPKFSSSQSDSEKQGLCQAQSYILSDGNEDAWVQCDICDG